jgi:predicted HTH transcriptional regulator
MRPVVDWEECDLDELHRGEIMESLSLEYKDSRVLENRVYQQGELFKDVSAFANSAGGILIFGMRESGHLPIGTDDGVDPKKIKREWLENILTANIQPKIEGHMSSRYSSVARAPATSRTFWKYRRRSRAARIKDPSINITNGTTSKPSLGEVLQLFTLEECLSYLANAGYGRT